MKHMIQSPIDFFKEQLQAIFNKYTNILALKKFIEN